MPVVTESGPVEGLAGDGVTIFRGIPYAAAPVGERRWREPAPALSWQGVRKADHFSPACSQTGPTYPPDQPVEAVSEDCLFLNIWRPAAEAPLPVLVWIHGGGLQNGSGSLPVYEGSRLARRGIIVVTLNYRLNALGFLAHPSLTAESPAHVSGNFGLLDQIAALSWVQRNIAAFGGDPTRVTVAGQSAGSNGISVLSASPLAKGLFGQIIGQSGGLFEPMELSDDFALAGAEQDGLHFAGQQDLAALRAQPADALLQRRFDPHPIIDGHLLKEGPYDVYRQNEEAPVRLLIGYDEGDGLPFLEGRSITAENYRDELRRDFPSLLVRLLTPSSVKDDAQAKQVVASVERDLRFRWDMWRWARSAREPVFLYRFAVGDAPHGSELPIIFSGSGPMADYWVNFVKTGDPNGSGLPVWPAFTEDEHRLMSFTGEAKAEPVPDEASLRSIERVYLFPRTLVRYWHKLF
jgi:para-nitrobenzyl esterase